MFCTVDGRPFLMTGSKIDTIILWVMPIKCKSQPLSVIPKGIYMLYIYLYALVPRFVLKRLNSAWNGMSRAAIQDAATTRLGPSPWAIFTRRSPMRRREGGTLGRRRCGLEVET